MRKSIAYTLLLVVIIIVGFLCYKISLGIIYPVKYETEIKYYSEKYNLSPSLVASVIKVESGYNEKALSSSNAIGLMQLLPSTANEIASKLNMNNFGQQDLYIPSLNIEFGCYYLNYLSGIMQNQKNVLYSYNVGFNKVKEWLNNSDYSVDKINLSVVPFEETKNYVIKVEKAIIQYKKHYKS